MCRASAVAAAGPDKLQLDLIHSLCDDDDDGDSATTVGFTLARTFAQWLLGASACLFVDCIAVASLFRYVV